MVQFLSHPLIKKMHIGSVAKSWLTLWDPMDCSTPGFPVLHYLLGFTQIHVHWVSGAIQPSHPLLPPSPSLNLSQHQGLFQWVSSSHQVAKVLELQLQLQSLQWYSGLISFRMDWFDLLTVQGTLKNLLQHHSSKASILWCSAFIMAQLSHPYMTSRKTIVLTTWTFVKQESYCPTICLPYCPPICPPLMSLEGSQIWIQINGSLFRELLFRSMWGV